jgi:uncharacterized glyoxalase superfamily protein PhnB
MRIHFLLGLALMAMFSFVSSVRADDTAVTLKGTMTCAKCDLHISDTCQSVLQVKDGDTTVTYYIADSDASKGTHEKVCKAAVDNVTITGAVADKDGKKWITPTKIDGLPS